MSVSKLVAHCVLIISSKMINARDVNSICVVGAVIVSVSYDGVGFAKSSDIGEGRHHGATDSVISERNLSSLVT